MANGEAQIDVNAVKTLFGNNLYSIDKEDKPEEVAGDQAVKKEILILLREHVLPGDPLYIFLQGILNACRLKMEDVNMLVSFRQDADFNTLRSRYGASLVIMFGAEAADIGLPVYFPHFQLQAHAGVNYISSPDLAVIENDKPAKQQLWQSLKKAFSL